MTRSSRYKAKDHPTTTVRMAGGVCVHCHTANTPPCKGCGCKLRISSVPVELAPGTKIRYAEGLCKICWFLNNPKQVAEEPEETYEVTPDKLAHTIRGLEAYMARRRERIGAAA